jgi:hypothetical protein
MEPVRFYHLRAVARSAAHGEHALGGGEEEETYAMERGSALHHLVFGTAKVIGYIDGKPRRGKEWEEFAARHAGAEILTASDYERASRMAEAVTGNKLAMSVLRGAAEESFEFDWLGRRCRATPDIRAAGYVTELKSTMDASIEKFGWQSRRLHYHAALAWYLQAVALSELGRPSDALIVAVESSPPWPVVVRQLTPQALDVGARLVRLWMERLLVCERSGQWPGYAQGIVPLDIEPETELDFDGVPEAA